MIPGWRSELHPMRMTTIFLVHFVATMRECRQRIPAALLVVYCCCFVAAVTFPPTVSSFSIPIFFAARQRLSKSAARFMSHLDANADASSSNRISDDPSVTETMATVSFTNVKAVIFDIDGTLADSGQLGFDATQVILQKYGYPPITHDEYCDGTRYTTPDRLARHAGFTSPEQEGYERIGQAMGRDFDDLYIDLVNMATAAFYNGMYDLVRNIPDHVHVGALTNAAERYAHAVLKANDAVQNAGDSDSDNDSSFALYQRFASIRGADTVARPKPFADGLLQICREIRADLDPSTCVYIGDSPSDGMAATAAGMPSIGVTWGAHRAEKLQPHFAILCNTVSELASLLPQKTKLDDA